MIANLLSSKSLRLGFVFVGLLAGACGPEPSNNGSGNGSNNGTGTAQTGTPGYTPTVPNPGLWPNNTPCDPATQSNRCESGWCAPKSSTCENFVDTAFTPNQFSTTGTSSVDLTIVFYPASGGLTRAEKVGKNSCFYVKSDTSRGETSYTLKWSNGDGKNEFELWTANGKTFAGMTLPFSAVTVIESTHKVYEVAELAIGEGAIGGTHVAKKMDRSKLPARVEMDAQFLGQQGSCGNLGSCPCR